MKWTTEKPTREGHYWVGSFVGDAFSADIRYAFDDDDMGLCWDATLDFSIEPIADDAEGTVYYGPFTYPEPPMKEPT